MTIGEFATFPSPVDTPQDAALLAIVRGHRIRRGVRNARVIGDGFEIATETGLACWSGTHEDLNTVRVDRGGAFTVVATMIVREGDPGCAIGR